MIKRRPIEPSDAPATPQPSGAACGTAAYQPAVNAHARRMIARIRRNHQDTEAVLALQAHYELHGDLPSLANLMEGWAQTLRDDRKAADAYVKAAGAVEAALSADPMRARALYMQALQRYPEHGAALERLEALLLQRDEVLELERCLQQVLCELARRNAPAALRAGLHHRLGQHYEHRLGLAGRAIAQYRAALELDPRMLPAIRAARGIYVASNKTRAAADMFELEIAAEADRSAQHALLLALAGHHRDALVDFDGAVLALRRALKALPGDAGTLERLADLLRERAALTRAAQAEADRARAAELYYQVARSVPRSSARPRLVACLALQPSHARAQRMLDELEAYGSTRHAQAELGASAQAELDALPTGRYPAARDPRSDAAGSSGRAATQGAPEPPRGAEVDVAAWLEDEAVTLIDEDAGPSSMTPVTDRPPPPDAQLEQPNHPALARSRSERV